MSDTKQTPWTPGKWHVGQTYSTHNAPTRFWETTVTSEIYGRVGEGVGAWRDEAEANAGLLALAPEMTEALAEAVAWIDRLKPSVALEIQRGASPLDWVDSARALLDRLPKGGA